MQGKHIDFTGVTIIDAETGRYSVKRVDPREHRCESCMEPAEYEIRSEWDKIGQCDVGQCQGCMLDWLTAGDSPDEYIINA
jgi:hypothetical protein